jgi:hypothetical protein
MAETLIRLLADTKKPGVCSAASCRAAIDWYRTLSGASMPMNRGAVPRTSEPLAGQTVGFFSSEDSHWASCVARGQFGRHAR